MPVHNTGSIAPERFEYEAQRSLQRIHSRLEVYRSCNGISEQLSENDLHAFEQRLETHWKELFRLFYKLYGTHYDFHYHLEQLILSAFASFVERSPEMKQLDAARLREPLWYRRETMLGGALYVDLFSKDLKGLQKQIPYLKSMGFTYIHLMPLFKSPDGENDGGYAVSNYRRVDDRLGTTEDLQEVTREFRKAGISLVLDFIFNHTADDHEWAKRAQSGEIEYEDYFHIYPSREIPDRYDRTVREIFPTVRRGSFSWHNGINKWVWTTFNNYQWDLRYANPDVFRGMMQEMLFLSNMGVEILRLDAVAFIWKEEGTSCENLDKAHDVIRAYNSIARIAAPSLLFKSEAIVHPDEVMKYIDEGECQLSYNPHLKATVWEYISTRDASLLKKSIEHRHALPEACSWCNYLRGHDDIGWTFDDADAATLGINAFDHRQFLNRFYSGQFEGSFAKGVPFQYNPETHDMRVCGTLASLAGIEQAIEKDDSVLAHHAIERICVMHSVILSIGGIPLLYLGDEWGMLNDYDYVDDERKREDSRWVHRVALHDTFPEPGKGLHPYSQVLHERICKLLEARRSLGAFAGVEMQLFDVGKREALSYVRQHSGERILVVQNLSDRTLEVDGSAIISRGPGHHFIDRITQTEHTVSRAFELKPYQHLWLQRC
ncbi:MAG: amylosucrase [Puniceicoccaceae bacterium]